LKDKNPLGSHTAREKWILVADPMIKKHPERNRLLVHVITMLNQEWINDMFPPTSISLIYLNCQ